MMMAVVVVLKEVLYLLEAVISSETVSEVDSCCPLDAV